MREVRELTIRWMPTTVENNFMRNYFYESCIAIGQPITVKLVTSVEYTVQNEPTYTRSEEELELYCMLETTLSKKTLINKGWMRENSEEIPILAHIPTIYYVDGELTELPLQGCGHILTLPDDQSVLDLQGSEYIVEKSVLSADKDRWTVSLLPYRSNQLDEVVPDSGGIKSDGSLLKSI